MGLNKHSLEKTGQVAVEGGTITYRYYEPHNPEAAKRTPLIAIHGGPGGSHAGMYDALHELADTRPVIFYDQLGSHFSPAEMTPELMRVPRFVDELKCLVDALGIEKADLLGHSWGGTIAALFAMDNPDRVEKLILSAPLLSTPRWIADCNKLLDKFPQEIIDTMRRCEADGTTGSPEYEAADEIFSKQHYCRTDPAPEAVAKHRSKTNKLVYGTMWGPSEFTSLGTLRDLDIWPRLHEIATPTLLICGEYDTATPATMKDAQAEIAGAKVVVIPDAAHGIYVDNNAAYIKAVNDFLASEAAPAAKPAFPAPGL